MSYLPESSQAFAEVAGNRENRFGVHDSSVLSNSWSGLYIGEQEFNPAVHDPYNISPYSVMEEITGKQQVRQVLKSIPADITIVTEYDETRDSPEVNNTRYIAGEQLREALSDSLPRVGDNIYRYHIGAISDEADMRRVEVIEKSKDPIEHAHDVADICRNGLTIIIGRLHRGDIDLKTAGLHVENTIGVRVLHPDEVGVTKGTRLLGKGNEINSRRDAAKYSKKLEAYNQFAEQSLQQSGMQIARVIIQNTAEKGQIIDPKRADTQIATALRNLYY